MNDIIKRTDLAFEAKEIWAEAAEDQTKLEGVEAHDSTIEGCAVTTVKILDERGEKSLGKPVGTYITKADNPKFQGNRSFFTSPRTTAVGRPGDH